MRPAPSTAARARARPGSCAARASPCRWGGRSARRRPASSSRPRSSARLEVGHDLDRRSRQAAVGAPQRELGGAVAREDEPLDAREAAARSRRPRSTRRRGRRRSRRSARATSDPRGAAATSVRTTSFAPAGFFTSSSSTRRSPIVDALEASERRPAARSPVDDLVGRGAERAGERRGGERVVDVVEAGKRRSGRARDPSGRTRSNDVASSPCSSTVAGADLERRPRVPARGAAVVPEMPDVGGRVVVRRAAAEAVLRVGGVLERRAGLRGVVETEGDAARRSRARSPTCGSSALTTSVASAGSAPTAVAPALGDLLQLAVAVELVAKQVAEAHRPRPDAPRDVGKGRPRPPRTGRARASRALRRVEATPETRFAPELLCASLTRGERIEATNAAVVVFPFVAETIAVPEGSRAASAESAPGSIVARILPGSVVPPPRPARRDSRPAERASATSRARRIRGQSSDDAG